MKWRVKVANRVRPWIEIEADYHRVEQGCLMFRTNRHGPQQYPVTVHVLAPGEWFQVKAVLPPR